MRQTSERKGINPSILGVLILFKILVLIGVWLSLDSGIRLGDAALLAAEKTTVDDKTVQPGTAKEADGNKKASKDGEKDTTTSEGDGKSKETETAAGSTRKSFLANLLELPPLDPDSHKKDELGKYLEIAERKKKQIEERLEIMKNRESQLKKLESSIDDKLRLLDEERRYFAQTIQQEKTLKGERTDKLVTLYAKMEPKKAAPVFEKLDKDLVVELFKQLPQKQVTLILETMNPERSVFLSEYYGRVRSAREYDLLKELNQSLRKEFDECKGLPMAAERSAKAAE